MRKIAVFLAAVAAILLVQSYTTAGRAQGLRTWVSATGDNINFSTGCQASAPCAKFSTALGQTLLGGEINCLNASDPIPETNVTLTFTITIDCHGTFGGIIVNNAANAFVINAPGAVVTLRGLNIDGVSGVGTPPGAGLNGVVIQAAAVVNIEDCVIENFSQNGISDQRGGSGQLFIKNTVVRNNGTSGSGGIDLVAASGVKLQVAIEHSQITGNNFGIGADGRQGGTISATISDSLVYGSTANGVTAITSSSSVALLLDQTKVTGNSVGLFASGGAAAMAVRNSSIFNNTTGLETVGGGRLLTYGNNSVIGNPTEGAFTGPAALQ